MPRMTGKRALMEMLSAEGIEYIFGNPGTTETPIMDELEHHPGLKYILVLQEGVAMGMADAYARATGKPAFVNLHIETGLGNAISLLQNAYDGGTPLVLSAGNKDMSELAQGRTDLAGMVRLLTKWAAEVTHPGQVPSVMRRAFNEAKTPPTGPTFVAFSANALDHEAEMEIVPSSRGYFQTAPDSDAIQDAARILASASRPIMIVEDRVAQSGAISEAVRVAELLGAEVYSCRYTDMSFPTSHPQFVDMTRLGFPDSRERMSRGDAVLMVGNLASGYTMFSDPLTRFFDPGTKLVHINSDPSNVGRSQPTEVGIISDAKVALEHLTDALEMGMSGTEREAAKGRVLSISEQTAARRSDRERRVKERWDDTPMSPERMMAELAGALPPDTVIADDAVSSRGALFGAVPFDRPGSIIGGRGGAIGWGIGAAMGLKLAHPDKPVVAVLGDGSAMMTVQGLWTAANENIPVVYVVCNNGAYRVLKVNMDAYKDLVLHDDDPRSRYLGMDFPIRLNIAGMAEAMGVHGRKVEDPTELGPAVRAALDLGKPAVVDVVIDGSV